MMWDLEKTFIYRNVIYPWGFWYSWGLMLELVEEDINMRESMFALVHKGDNPKSNLSIENDVWIGEEVTILGKVSNIGDVL